MWSKKIKFPAFSHLSDEKAQMFLRAHVRVSELVLKWQTRSPRQAGDVGGLLVVGHGVE